MATAALALIPVVFAGTGESRTTTSATYVVTNTNDSGGGSLRQAILDANANSGQDTIDFAIPGGGVHTITPTSALPQVTDPVLIDGYSQSGASQNTLAVGDNAVLLIELDGSLASNTFGLNVGASGTTIQGLVINRWRGGIQIGGADGARITGNYIGTDPTGTVDRGNTHEGVILNVATNGIVGGTAPADRNVISGNDLVGVYVTGSGHVVAGNYIGTNAAGIGSVANQFGVQVIGGAVQATGNTIGGSSAGAGNVVSGNSQSGILLNTASAGATHDNAVQGNLIGTQADGTSQLGNGFDGVRVPGLAGGGHNTIGGLNAGQGNVIAFNGEDGVRIGDTVSSSDFSTGEEVLGNSIYSNTGLGIDLNGDGVTSNDAPGALDADTGGNNLQNFPVLSSASSGAGSTTVAGVLDSAASSSYRVDFYASPACDTPSAHGEGKAFLGSVSVSTDSSGHASFPSAVLGTAATVGDVVTATATDAQGSTSEFSSCVTVSSGGGGGGGGSTFTVTNANDSGNGSLRQAILDANAQAGQDAISFAIPGSGVHTIQPISPLPTIADPVVIDGTTQAGFVSCAAGPVIELDGTNLTGPVRDALTITGGGTTVRGLAINRFSFPGSSAIYISGGGGNTIECNYIGTNAAGNVALGNRVGITLDSTHNTVGGTTSAAHNVIAGNIGVGIRIDFADNLVEGNYIGTNAAGTAALGTALGPNAIGIFVNGSATGTGIGGTTAGARNVISGNGGFGVAVNGPGTVVQGNYIGLSADGTAAVANVGGGVVLNEGTIDDVIGGTAAGARNVISGNGGYGIFIIGAGGVVQGNRIEGNYIGMNAAGDTALGNTSGGIGMIHATFGSRNQRVGGTASGAGNLISGNGGPGISITGSGSTANPILGNSIYANAGIGIDLGADGVTGNDPDDADTGPNDLQNFPDITAANVASSTTTIQGSFDGAPGTYRVEFFVNSACSGGVREGKTFLSSTSVTVAGTADATFSVSVPRTSAPLGSFITATATANDGAGSTSELSGCRQVAPSVTVGPTCNKTDPSDAIEAALPPADLRLNQYESDHCLYLFTEQQDVALAHAVGVRRPQATNMLAGPSVTLPAGAQVDSFLLHGDSLGLGGAGAHLSGSWSFEEPILGVVVTSAGLNATDSLTGLSDLTYEHVSTARGLEGPGYASDVVTVDAGDAHLLHVDISFNVMDEIRVYTGVLPPPPPDCIPDTPGNAIVAPPDPPTPADLRLNQYESDHCLYLFTEQQDVALAHAVGVRRPQATNMLAGPSVTLPAGAQVDSFLLHGDSLGLGGAGAHLSGSWSFEEPILGVVVTSAGLNATDSLTGLSDLTYEHVSTARGLEGPGYASDVVTVDAGDAHLLHVDISFNVMDEIRVYTGVLPPPPPDCIPDTPGNAIVAPPDPPTPADLRLNQYESDHCLYLFTEQQDVALAHAVGVRRPQATNMLAGPSVTLPAGAQVDSFLLHGDSLGLGGAGAHLSGSWSFEEPILGVVVTSAGLNATDSLTGLSDLTYEHVSTARGLEGPGYASDVVTVDAGDAHLLHVDISFNVMDEIRVYTGVLPPPPPDCIPDTPGNAIVAPPDPPTPADLRLNQYESDHCLYLFTEQQDVALAHAVGVRRPQATNMLAGPSVTLPAGAQVDSFLLHGDSLGLGGAGAHLSGSWSFEEPILGVVVTSAGLNATDSLTGLSDLTYEHVSTARGLEGPGYASDVVTVDAGDAHLLHVDISFNVMDEIRVYTGVLPPPPPDCIPDTPGNAIVAPPDPPTPADLRLNQYESDHCLYLFTEQQDVALPQAITIERASSDMIGGPTRLVPAGTVVDSYLLHGDAIGSPTNGVTLSGSLTFDTPVLGAVVTPAGLHGTDVLTGLSDISYEPTSTARGVEGPPGDADAVSVDPQDPFTLHVTFSFNALDEIRVYLGVVPTGTLMVVKDAVPDRAQDFSFSATGGISPSSFSLDDDGNETNALPSSRSFVVDARDGYSVGESEPSGWTQTNATCDNGSPVTNIAVPAGGVVRCTFVNVRNQGSIELKKRWVGPAASTTLAIGTSAGANDVASKAVTSDDTTGARTVDTGTFFVSEAAVTGYTPSLACANNQNPLAPVAVTVGPNNSVFVGKDAVVVCTFTNTQQPRLTLAKIVSGGGTTASLWTLTATGSNGFSGPGPSTGAHAVDAGVAYTLSESGGPSGYTAGAWACSGGSQSGDHITLSATQNVTCTITNTRDQGTIELRKEWIGAAGSATLKIGSSAGAQDIAAVTLTTNGTTDRVSADTGTYYLSETVINPAAYDSSLTCFDDADSSGFRNGSEPVITPGVNNSISVGKGAHVLCTFTNARLPQLIVIKHVVNDNGGSAIASQFTMTINGVTATGGNSFPGAESPGTNKQVTPGSYSVTETGPSGYGASFSADCTGSITLGQTKTCTVTNNDIAPKLIVIKHVANGPATASQFTLDSGGTNDTPDDFPGSEAGTTVTLDAGSYHVTENPVAGYSATYGATCAGSIAVGQTKTCTVTNTLSGDTSPHHIYMTGTTCQNFRDTPTQFELTQIQYTTKGKSIDQVNPGVFFYYASVTAPSSGTWTINSGQSNNSTTPTWRAVGTNKDQIILYTPSCVRVQGVVTTSASGTVAITVNQGGYTPGAIYIYSVKYDPNNLVGQTVSTNQTVTYTFWTINQGLLDFGSFDGIKFVLKK